MKNSPITPMEALPLFSRAQAKANETIEGVNKMLTLHVVFVANGASTLTVGSDVATLTISTKDINLGAITGSKAGNAALASLLTALSSAFTIRDGTT